MIGSGDTKSRPARVVGLLLAFLATSAAWTSGAASAAESAWRLEPGDHVAYIGNTLADRMQHDGWLETFLHAHYPEHELTFRNLGFSADEITVRLRSENFGDPDQWLSKVQADVVLCFFGYNEALRGLDGLPQFKRDLEAMIDGMRAQRYNGESAPRLVVCSPIAHEDLKSPHLPDGVENNRRLQQFAEAMREVCAERGVTFVDLFGPTQRLYAEETEPLTMNGIHLNERGNRLVAEVIFRQLLPDASLPDHADLSLLREAVLDKNYHWFSRYRVVDEYNVFGGRSTLAWHGQSNADVMQREMEIFDVMTANRDRRVWAAAQGRDVVIPDDNLPPELEVKTNKPGPLPGEQHPYYGGEEALTQMKTAPGMEVNLFASEQQFPRLVNPVQMAVDTDSRLWVAVWPSYPHWNPTEPRRDAILILPDDNGDGRADDCIVFADELNSVTGFEFWGGGVLVAAPPELWFLKDTDGDDKADVKIRVLQGVSSADTHHSANAMLIGPDGWLYWSRGIFNVASFETPTKTFRSGESGVYRFNPRTFEIEFHFPIGPNPHGDVFDRWGYQFANDGTSGTGSYVNIGKGIGNKQWFEKRVRPVAATGILSSSHFPPENQGNFLICNTIGVLGVLQHKVSYQGADIRATEIEPILLSTDQNFRPSDVEVGGDGALYVADWHNVLIGHMQHNMRDPNRDAKHGRVYRVTYGGRELLQPPKLKGKPLDEVCQSLLAPENGARYRARIELSGRDSQDVIERVGAFAASLDPRRASPERDEAQALLECLWVFAEQRVPRVDLVEKTFQAEDPRVRAAAIRTLGYWGGRVDGWEAPLLAAARDQSPLVRAEAIKAAVEFDGLAAAEAVFEAATRPTDPELDAVLAYAERQLQVDAIVRDAIQSGRPLSPAARNYLLARAKVADLLQLERSADVYQAVLNRSDATAEQLAEAFRGLAGQGGDVADLLLDRLESLQAEPSGNVSELGKLLARLTPSRLKPHLSRVERLAAQGATPEVRRPAYAAWVATAGADDPFLAATRTPQALRDFLDAAPLVDERVRETLYEKIRPLAFDLPPQLQSAANEGGGVPGLRVEFFHPFSQDVTQEALDGQKPLANDEASEVSLNLPIVQQGEQFALRFTATLQAPQSGTYRFSLVSDDGSRLYVDQRELINHDGPHGMTEKSASVELSAGPHAIVVTYRNITGDKGLQLLWEGPGVERQPLGGEYVTIGGGNSLQQAAILALATIGGHDDDKFAALASLMASGSHRPAVIRALGMLPPRTWPADLAGNLVDNLLGYVSSLPPRSRTGDSAVAAIDLVKALAKSLPADQAADALNRLESLDVRVIALGVVPHRMIYDKEQMVVGVGETVEFRFANIDAMPHNFAIVRPGALREVGELAEATSSEPDAPARGYVPNSDQILLASRLLQPGDKQSLSFTAPLLPGVYPYVCTYPGHWRRMYGALYVVEDLEAYQSNPDAYLAAARLPVLDEQLASLGRNREWSFEELAKDVLELPAGRSYEVGKQLFATASCQACHKLAGEGYEVGPDLAKLDDKKHNTEYILRSLLEPSRDIDAKYQNHTFLLDTGLVVTGMIVGETPDEVQVVIDPLAKSHPTTIRKAEIEERSPSDISPMPTGLLNRLTQEEILDLIAYVYAGGDPEAEIYADGHHHHHHGAAPSVDHDHAHEDAHGHEHDHDHGHGDEHEHE